MQISVNDMQREVRDGTTVTELLQADQEPIGHVLVEINGVQLHVHEYEARVLEGGDRVEIIYPAAGG